MTTILILGYAEKPEGQIQGVKRSGCNAPKWLIPRGWQWAGANASFLESNTSPGPWPELSVISN
jgi:hypothetical protein